MEPELRSHLLKHGLAIENVDLIAKQDSSLATVEDLAMGAAAIDDSKEWAAELGLVTVAMKTRFSRSWLEASNQVKRSGAARATSKERRQAREHRERRKAEALEREKGLRAQQEEATARAAQLAKRKAEMKERQAQRLAKDRKKAAEEEEQRLREQLDREVEQEAERWAKVSPGLLAPPRPKSQEPPAESQEPPEIPQAKPPEPEVRAAPPEVRAAPEVRAESADAPPPAEAASRNGSQERPPADAASRDGSQERPAAWAKLMNTHKETLKSGPQVKPQLSPWRKSCNRQQPLGMWDRAQRIDAATPRRVAAPAAQQGGTRQRPHELPETTMRRAWLEGRPCAKPADGSRPWPQPVSGRGGPRGGGGAEVLRRSQSGRRTGNPSLPTPGEAPWSHGEGPPAGVRRQPATGDSLLMPRGHREGPRAEGRRQQPAVGDSLFSSPREKGAAEVPVGPMPRPLGLAASFGARASAAQPATQTGQTSFSIATPRPAPVRRSLQDEPKPKSLTDEPWLSEPLPQWSMHQVLRRAKPKWSSADAHYCQQRLKKIGIDSVDALAEAVARDLNQRLREQALGVLAGSTITGLRELLWEHPGTEEFGEDVVDESDAESRGCCAELVSEFMPWLDPTHTEEENEAAPAENSAEYSHAQGSRRRAGQQPKKPAKPKKRPSPAPLRPVVRGDMLSQLEALEAMEDESEDEDEKSEEAEEEEEEEDKTGALALLRRPGATSPVRKSVTAGTEEEPPPAPPAAARPPAGPPSIQGPPARLRPAAAELAAARQRSEDPPPPRAAARPPSEPPSAAQEPAAAPRPRPAATCMVRQLSEDGNGSEAEGEEGAAADIFDAPAELWLQAQASPAPKAKSRPAQPERHQLASLCGWEGEGDGDAESGYEIFDAPADDWISPKPPEDAASGAAQPSSSSTSPPSADAADSAKSAAAEEERRRRRRESMDDLTHTPELARVLGAAAGIAMAFQVAVLSRSFRDWMLRILPGLIMDTPADIFLLGGHRVDERWSAGSKLMRLCVRTLEWEPLPPMSTRRTFATAVSAMGKVYVVGGFDGRRLLETAERFDLSSRTWETLPPMSCPRHTCGAAAIHGSIYVVGGVGDQLLPHDAYERFDSALHRWEPVPPTSLGCSTDVAVAAVRQHLYVVGFLDGRSEFERLNPASEQWEKLPPLTPGLAKNVLTGAVGIGDRLFVCSARILAIRIFNCRTGGWEPPPHTRGITDSVSCGRSISVTATGGQLFVVGTWLEKAGRDTGRYVGDTVPAIGCLTYCFWDASFRKSVSRCLRRGLSKSRRRSGQRFSYRGPRKRPSPSPRRRGGEQRRRSQSPLLSQGNGWQQLHRLDGTCLRWGCGATSARC